jgi:hypothetical protein
MRNGSFYVAAVFVVLFGYFGYQWWLNPSRAVKRRLGEVAATLSAPANESQMARIARLARLRRYLSENLRVRSGALARDLTSRDELLAAAASWRPSENGWDVHFADLHITIESETAARAFLGVEVTTPDPQGHPTVDTRDAAVGLALRDGEWVITEAESKDPPRP